MITGDVQSRSCGLSSGFLKAIKRLICSPSSYGLSGSRFVTNRPDSERFWPDLGLLGHLLRLKWFWRYVNLNIRSEVMQVVIPMEELWHLSEICDGWCLSGR